MAPLLLLSAAAASAAGTATLVVEFDDGAVRVQENWELRGSGAPVTLPLAEGAETISDVEGWSHVPGQGLVSAGPIGRALQQVVVGYRVPSEGASVELRWPAPDSVRVEGVRIAHPKLDGLLVQTSPSPASAEPIDRMVGGVLFVLRDVDTPFRAGPLTITLRGLPTRAGWPRWVAIGLSVVLVVAVVVLWRLDADPVAPRTMDEPAAQQHRILEALHQLEANAPDMDPARAQTRREELVAALARHLRENA